MSRSRKWVWRQNCSLSQPHVHSRFRDQRKALSWYYSHGSPVFPKNFVNRAYILSLPKQTRGVPDQQRRTEAGLLIPSSSSSNTQNLTTSKGILKTMAGAIDKSNASPFDFSSQSKPAASLGHQAIIWIVVLSCTLVAAFIVIICLLCRCRRKRKNRRVSRGYSVKDGRNDFHPWNKNAAPLPMAPAFGGYGVAVIPEEQPTVTKPSRIAARPAVIEPMIVEQADDHVQTARNSRKTSRYYTGVGWSKRLSRFSQIGRAF